MDPSYGWTAKFVFVCTSAKAIRIIDLAKAASTKRRYKTKQFKCLNWFSHLYFHACLSRCVWWTIRVVGCVHLPQGRIRWTVFNVIGKLIRCLRGSSPCHERVKSCHKESDGSLGRLLLHFRIFLTMKTFSSAMFLRQFPCLCTFA